MRVAFKLNREDKNSQCDHTEFENGTTDGAFNPTTALDRR